MTFEDMIKKILLDSEKTETKDEVISKVVDKVYEHLGEDIVEISKAYSLSTMKDDVIVSPKLVHRLIMSALCTLLANNKIIIKTTTKENSND